jgi:acyl carrier protein
MYLLFLSILIFNPLNLKKTDINIFVIYFEENMTDQEKIAFLKASIQKLFKKEPPEITREMQLADLELDSLDIVELQMEFEKEFNVEIPDPVNVIVTVGDLLDHLQV